MQKAKKDPRLIGCNQTPSLEISSKEIRNIIKISDNQRFISSSFIWNFHNKKSFSQFLQNMKSRLNTFSGQFTEMSILVKVCRYKNQVRT